MPTAPLVAQLWEPKKRSGLSWGWDLDTGVDSPLGSPLHGTDTDTGDAGDDAAAESFDLDIPIVTTPPLSPHVASDTDRPARGVVVQSL